MFLVGLKESRGREKVEPSFDVYVVGIYIEEPCYLVLQSISCRTILAMDV